MNSVKWSITLCLLVIAVALRAQNISIAGHVDGAQSGTVLLIAQPHETSSDTIAKASINNGYFKMVTSLTQPQALRLALRGYDGGFTLLAEPDATYQAQLAHGRQNAVWGAPLQDTYNLLQEINAKNAKQLEILKAKYDSIKQIGRFRTASRVNDTIVALQQAKKVQLDSILNANDNLLTAFIVWNNVALADKSLEECRSAYNKLGAGAKQTQPAHLIEERIKRLAQIEHGNLSPDFELCDVNGNSLKLSNVNAKLKIIDFWASWCGPCRLNNPSLKKLYEECHAQGLEIIAVSLDEDKTAWQTAIKQQNLPWIHVSSLKGWKCPVAALYSVTTVPAMFVLDKNNNIIATQLRGDNLTTFVKEQLGLKSNAPNE